MASATDRAARVDALRAWARAAKLDVDYAERRKLILDLLDDEIRAYLEIHSRPHDQLLADLRALGAHQLDDGRDALDAWRAAAEAVVMPTRRRRWLAGAITLIAVAVTAALALAPDAAPDPCAAELADDPAQLRLRGSHLTWDLATLNRRVRAVRTAQGPIELAPGALRALVAEAGDSDRVEVELWTAAGPGRVTVRWRARQGRLRTRWTVDGRPVERTGDFELVLAGADPLPLAVAEPGGSLSRVVGAEGCWDQGPWPAISVEGGRFRLVR